MNSQGVLTSRFSFWCEGRKGDNNIALLSEFVASVMTFVLLVITLLEIAYTTIFITGADATGLIIDYVFESESKTEFIIKTDIELVFSHLIYAFSYHLYIMSIAVFFLVGRLARIETVAIRSFVGLVFFFVIVFISILALGIETPNRIIHIEKVSNSICVLSFWYFGRSGLFVLFVVRYLYKKELDKIKEGESLFVEKLLFDVFCLGFFSITIFALIVHSMVPLLDFINSI